MVKNKLVFSFFVLIFAFKLSWSQLVYNNEQIFYCSAGAIVKIDGDVLNNNGSINIAQENDLVADFYVLGNYTNDGSSVVDGNLNLEQNFYNNSEFSSNSGLVNLIGQNQIIGGSQETSFYNLYFVNHGIKTLENSINIKGKLNLNNSELKTKEFKVFVENNNEDAILFVDGFVSSDKNGFLQRNMKKETEYYFPLGVDYDSPIKRHVVINSLNNDNSKFNCRFANINVNDEQMYSSLLHDSIEYLNENWYHVINRIGGNNPVELKINYLSSDGEFNHFANWKTSPTTIWDIFEDSYSSEYNSQLYVMAELISNFSNPDFALCYKKIIVPEDPIEPENPEDPIDPDIPEDPDSEIPIEEELLIYNSFSPNADSYNDTWVVENCEDCDVRVYNRNGNLVFESIGNTVSWDGKYKNERVPDASYFYVIQKQSSGKVYKGSVTIIR